MAIDTKDIGSFGEEASGPYGLLAVAAFKAFLMPGTALILHIFSTWLDQLVASIAAQGVLSGGALSTHNFIVLENKLFVGQRMVALGTAEASIMPVTALIMQLLGIHSNGFSAFSTGVGTDFLKALYTAVVSILLHILLPLKGSSAVVAIKAFGHCARGIVAWT